jgi:DNA-binding NtrC family response regulator
MKVLIGDDKEEVRNTLESALKLRKLEADLVSTSKETIAKAKTGNYSVVITDLEYTKNGEEGYEVLREIRDLPALKILYTGLEEFDCAIQGITKGADYVILGKDVSQLMELLEKVEEKENNYKINERKL